MKFKRLGLLVLCMVLLCSNVVVASEETSETIVINVAEEIAEVEEDVNLLEYDDGSGDIVYYYIDDDGLYHTEDGELWQHPDYWTSTTGFGYDEGITSTYDGLTDEELEDLNAREVGVSYWEEELDTDEVSFDYTDIPMFSTSSIILAVEEAGMIFEDGVATATLDPESAFALQSYLYQFGVWERTLYRLEGDLTITIEIDPSNSWKSMLIAFSPALIVCGGMCIACYLSLSDTNLSTSFSNLFNKKDKTYTDKRKGKKKKK